MCSWVASKNHTRIGHAFVQFWGAPEASEAASRMKALCDPELPGGRPVSRKRTTEAKQHMAYPIVSHTIALYILK